MSDQQQTVAHNDSDVMTPPGATSVVAGVRDLNTQEVHLELQTVALANNGYLKPEDVLERARDPISPLHPFFEWDDSVAAEKLRLLQATGIIRRVTVNILPNEHATGDQGPKRIAIKRTRAYQSPQGNRASALGYQSVEAIMQDPEKRADMVATAKREFLALKKRYAMLDELGKIFEAIDALP